MRLKMLVEMQIEILDGGKILDTCNFKVFQNLRICTVRYKGIQIKRNSLVEFVPQDTEELEFLNFDC